MDRPISDRPDALDIIASAIIALPGGADALHQAIRWQDSDRPPTQERT